MDKEAEETTLYLRLVLLFTNVATNVVRRVFVHYAAQTAEAERQTRENALQTCETLRQSSEAARQTGEDFNQTSKDLKAFLSSHTTRRKLDELKRKQILSDLQFYMVTENNPRVEKFDISLLITLICKLFCEVIESPKRGWNFKKPAPTDLTLGADLIRLRNYRNKIVGHSSRAQISSYLFNEYWINLESILIRICRNISPSEEFNIKEEVRTYKDMSLDQQSEQRCRMEIQDLREKCKDIMKLQEQVAKLELEIKGKCSELEDAKKRLEDEDIGYESEPELFDWETCIEQLSEGKVFEAEKIAAYQFKGERHPNQSQLNRLQEMRETSHSILSEVGKRISSKIKSQSKHICNVWPAYKFEQRDRVVFVVETNTTHVLKFDTPYEYVVFSADYFSENRKIATNENNSDKDLPQSETMRLVEFIKNNAAGLFQKHRHLSYVKPSLLREEDCKKDKNLSGNLKKQCIAFYVRRKDYIPLDEEPFVSCYEDFSAVVREGAFSLQTGIKIGCGITCVQENDRNYSVKGTLGGFVEHPYYGLCGLTCSHVLLNAEEMQQLKQRRVISAPEKPAGLLVCSVAGSHIGRIVKVIYEEGSRGPSGMEIALFQIETGHPKTAEFEGCNQENFIKGRAYGDTRLCKGVHVYKLGANKTEGEIIGTKTMTVRTHEGFDALLYNQIEVKRLHTRPFSENGDSGSLVFIKEDDEYICIGMIVGGTMADEGNNTWGVTSVVTPIVPVLNELNVTAFKSFVTDSLEERFSCLNSSMQEMEVNISSLPAYIESRLEAHVSSLQSNIQSRMEANNSSLQTNIGRMMAELLQNLERR